MVRLAFCGLLVACSSPERDVAIDRIAPASATNVASVPVQIEGSFRLPITSDVDNGVTRVGDMAVTIGDAPLENAVWRGEGLIEGAVPPHLPIGPHDVTVTLGDRTAVLDDAYTVVAINDPIDPAGDGDGDGIPNADDVCPTVPDPAQYDHDSDKHGDACDRCPHIPSAIDPDGDGDGIGDACDPRPQLAGDQRRIWVGFYDSDAATVMAWTTGGTWSVAGGMLNELGTSTTTFDYVSPPDVLSRAYVATAVRFNAMQGTTWTAGARGGQIGTPGASQQYYECFVYSGGSGASAPFVAAQSSFAGLTDIPRSTIAPGTVNEIIVQVDTSHRCSFDEPGTFNTVVSQGVGAISGQVAVHVQRATVSFDYLFVVETGN